MAVFTLGNIGFRNMGTWSETSTYEKNDVVFYSVTGSLYVCYEYDCPVGTVPTNENYWYIMVQANQDFDYVNERLDTAEEDISTLETTLGTVQNVATNAMSGVAKINKYMVIDDLVSFPEEVITKQTTVQDTLNVSGQATFDGFVEINDELDVQGCAQFNADTNVQGFLSCEDVTINNSLEVSGDTTISGYTIIRNDLDTTGDLTVGGAAQVTKDCILMGNLIFDSTQTTISGMQFLTQTAYDALTTKDDNTIYFIIG